MRTSRFLVILTFALSSLYLRAQTEEQKLIVTGKLSHAMAIGAETTGWTIELDSETTIAGKAVHSIEITYPKTEKLEKLANQHVHAKGKLAHRQGVETGDRVVLGVASIKAVPSE